MELVNEKAEEYAQEYSTPPDKLLQKIVAETSATHAYAQMLSSNTQGKLDPSRIGTSRLSISTIALSIPML